MRILVGVKRVIDYAVKVSLVVGACYLYYVISVTFWEHATTESMVCRHETKLNLGSTEIVSFQFLESMLWLVIRAH